MPISSLLDAIDALGNPRSLAAITTIASVALLAALIAITMRYLGLRHRLAEHEARAQQHAHSMFAGFEDILPPMSLEGEGRFPVDHLLPQRPRSFLLVVALLAVGCWLAGLALAADPWAFLASREWQAQPLYLAAHLITLRMFTTMFSRSFMAGVTNLDMSQMIARQRMQLILGPVGALVAVALAIPFCIYDYRVSAGERLGLDAGRLLFAVWCLEWFLLAFIWVQLVGFLILTRWAIREHPFRASIEMVLLEKQYRPFLQMSAQGATIVLGFFIVNVLYVWYTGGEITDYIGVGITLVLLVIGFVPPWLQLTAKVDRAVDQEMEHLRHQLAQAGIGVPARAAAAGQPPSVEDLQGRLDQALVMLRISYLERLYRDIGQTEWTNMLIKISVPVMTFAYYVMRYFKIMT